MSFRIEKKLFIKKENFFEFKKKLVSIVMGSQSDWKTLTNCENIFKNLGIDFEKKIVSFHQFGRE